MTIICANIYSHFNLMALYQVSPQKDIKGKMPMKSRIYDRPNSQIVETRNYGRMTNGRYTILPVTLTNSGLCFSPQAEELWNIYVSLLPDRLVQSRYSWMNKAWPGWAPVIRIRGWVILASPAFPSVAGDIRCTITNSVTALRLKKPHPITYCHASCWLNGAARLQH